MFSLRYTKLLRETCWGTREYDLLSNTIVMLAESVEDLQEDIYPENYDIVKYHKFQGAYEMKKERELFIRAQELALWPELYLGIKRIQFENYCDPSKSSIWKG